MLASYKTIKDKSEGLYREKGSKFIAIAKSVDSEKGCLDFLEECKKEYHDARHHCYAYVLGEAGDKWKVNDDGEPGHSAGDPILGQIRSYELTNTMIVVIRYFGGTKLGVSGLINAYRTAAREALDSATIIHVELREQLRIEYPYESTNAVMKLLNEIDAKVDKQSFDASCRVDLSVSRSKYEEACRRIKTLEQQSLLTLLHPHL